MKTLYFDCSSGISGNMTLGALTEIVGNEKYLLDELKKLNLDGYHIEVSKKVKNGITGTYLATRKILKEKTAETLRNEIPKVKSSSLNIITIGIFKKMGFNTKWNIRDMLRNKTRSITGIVGVTACWMLIVCAIGMFNSINYFIDLQLDFIRKFSLSKIWNVFNIYVWSK